MENSLGVGEGLVSPTLITGLSRQGMIMYNYVCCEQPMKLNDRYNITQLDQKAKECEPYLQSQASGLGRRPECTASSGRR